jgi:hypothetical protein
MATELSDGAELEVMDPWSAGIVLEPGAVFELQPASAMTAARAAADRVRVFFIEWFPL